MINQFERPTCRTCPFWRLVLSADDLGQCRRRTPVLCDAAFADALANEVFRAVDIDAETVQFEFSATNRPATMGDEWCGEHPDFPAWIKATRAS